MDEKAPGLGSYKFHVRVDWKKFKLGIILNAQVKLIFLLVKTLRSPYEFS